MKEILFECGTDIKNNYDNKVTKDDKVIFYLEAFVSNDGSLAITQV